MEDDNKNINVNEVTPQAEIEIKQPKKLDKKKKKKKKKQASWVFVLKIIIITFFTSLAFGFAAEITIVPANVIVAVFIVIAIIFVSITSDIIGTAAASCNVEPFLSMASRKVKGAKKAVWLVKHNEKVSTICNDVIGDICGIVSGAAGAAITIKIFAIGTVMATIGGILVSAIIASLTVGGKAVGKKIALSKNQKIIFAFAKFLSIFSRKM